MSFCTKFVKCRSCALTSEVLIQGKHQFGAFCSTAVWEDTHSLGKTCASAVIHCYKNLCWESIHSSLLGVSCASHLMLLKTDNADWGEEKISLQSSNVQTTRGSSLISVWRMLLLWNTRMLSKSCYDMLLLKSAQYAHNNEDNKVYFLTLGESYKTSKKWWSLISSLKMREIVKQLLKIHFVLFVNEHIPSINYKRIDTALICRWNTLAKLQLIVCENKLPWCWHKLIFQGK